MSATAGPRPSNDYSLYEELLQDTKDANDACHRDLAVDALVDSLLDDESRVREFVESHANRVANAFDKKRSAEAVGGQLSFEEDTWWVCGDSERVQSRDMRVPHLDAWFTIQRQQYTAQMAVFVVKSTDYDRYRSTMVSRNCTLWEARER